MRILATILLFCGLSFAQGTELLRPTADQNTGASTWVTTNCGINSYVASSTSGDLARDTGGLTTSVNYSISATTILKATARTWQTWASTANTYSALTLNVSASSAGATGTSGTAKVAYSIDSGSTWTLLSTPTALQATTTVALNAGQDLSKLRVGACASTAGADPGTGTNNIRLFDIWTSGTLGSAAAGTGSSAGTAVQPVQFN